MLNLLIKVSVLTVPRESAEYKQTKKNPLQTDTHPQEILIIYYYLQTTSLAARNTRNKGENRFNPFFALTKRIFKKQRATFFSYMYI